MKMKYLISWLLAAMLASACLGGVALAQDDADEVRRQSTWTVMSIDPYSVSSRIWRWTEAYTRQAGKAYQEGDYELAALPWRC
jgi:hypothetical protein